MSITVRFHVLCYRPVVLAPCHKCKATIDKNDEQECPLMFNLGMGVKYVCAKCYPAFVEIRFPSNPLQPQGVHSMAAGNKSEKEKEGFTFITPTGIATFVHVWEPFAFKSKDPAEQKEPSYRITLVFDEDADLSELKKICGRALAKKFGADECKALLKRKKLSLPWRDGVEYEEYGEPFTNDGAVFISASSRSAPGVVDARAKAMMKQQDFYPGCKARISVYAHAFDSKGNKGVTLLLNNVQKVGDGTKLAGVRKAAEDEFDAVEGSKGGDNDADDLF